ncbi:MAG: phenylacetate-CoA oxygenase subunit PaaI [Chloroflexi bacterium]|nr:phenylacetate-CoA oxygenase subunit PaaI [Chloroflexota bacterium]
MPDITDPKQLSDPARRALADLILALADTKRWLGIRYAEWCDSAPALEAAVAASAMAQDELGHSRALLPLLQDFPEIDPGIPNEAPRETYSSIAYLDQPFSTWNTFVVANLLLGEALTIALEAARQSSYVPLRTRAGKILEEERFHWLHGEGWFKRLAADPKDAERVELAQRVEEMLPHALCWFGRDETNALMHEKILDASADELRARFLTQVAPLIAKSQAASLVKNENGHWLYCGTLPWNKFDAATRRIE